MDKFVIDSSVVLKLISSENEKNVDQVTKLYEHLLEGKVELYAPDFLLVEVSNILFWKKKLPCADIKAFVERLLGSGINFFHIDEASASELVDLVCTYKITSYDAQFILLAKHLGCKLVSEDEQLKEIKEWVVGIGA